VAFFLGVGAERWYLGRPRVTTATAVSEGLATEIKQHYPQLCVNVITNGVDTLRFRPDAKARRSMRADLAVGTKDVVALFVGGRWDDKGLDVAIEALATVVPRVRERVLLWVVGRGDTGFYRTLAEEHRVGDRVRFLGSAKNPERFFQAADIFLLPSRYETFSLVVHEAASTAIPIIATPVNGVYELLADGEAGILVVRRPTAVADALERLASDPELRRRMGAAARSRIAGFSWQDSAERTVLLYRELLDGRR
jgi:UDP-glucose:(heptosyl)LPS alpha-1,3-glucosyltransferase